MVSPLSATPRERFSRRAGVYILSLVPVPLCPRILNHFETCAFATRRKLLRLRLRR
jgi:hypothetical protein